jgi:sulfatase maturation enzyme AslB (radical SAM superfamily)
MRTRREEFANYSSIFLDGKTLRIPLDKDKPITELHWPEFYDVGINSVCYAKCPWCYTSSTPKGINFDNIIDKIYDFFGKMTLNQRAFQVAIGGSGEATVHPKFIEVLETFSKLEIVPNYTTNAMHLSDKVIEATKKYCGGVAISLHPHLEKIWRKGIKTLINNRIKTNIHIIISDKDSIDYLERLYNEYNNRIDYFVLLPYMNFGFGGGVNSKEIDYDYLEKFLDKIAHYGNIAFGSNFYKFLQRIKKYNVSLYPPEILSKYLIMDDDMKLYNNSFLKREVKFSHETGVQFA